MAPKAQVGSAVYEQFEALGALASALDANRALWPSLQVAFLNEVGAPAMGVLVAREEDPVRRAAMLTALAAIADPRAGDALAPHGERGLLAGEVATELRHWVNPQVAR